MPVFVYAFILIYIFLLGYYTVYKKHSSFKAYSVVKMSMSTIFTGLAAHALFMREFSLLVLLVFISLCFAWAGDFFLRYMGKDAIKFNIGVVCFTVCQLLLTAVFIYLGKPSFALILAPMLTVLFTILFWLMLKFSKADLGISKPFIKSYMVTMSVLFGAAIYYLFSLNNPGTAAVMLGSGGIMFFISDVFLGVYSYLFKRRIFTVLNSLLYFGGMLMISLSLYF